MCVSQVGAGPAYGARLHCRWCCRSVDLPGDGGHAEARLKHWRARVQVRKTVQGGHDKRGSQDRPAAIIQKFDW